MEIDLISPDQWTEGVPHQQFEWLRRNVPVFWHPSNDPAIPGFWALTRHLPARVGQAISEMKGTCHQTWMAELAPERRCDWDLGG